MYNNYNKINLSPIFNTYKYSIFVYSENEVSYFITKTFMVYFLMRFSNCIIVSIDMYIFYPECIIYIFCLIKHFILEKNNIYEIYNVIICVRAVSDVHVEKD